jgi:hypothetical protein
MAKKANRDVIAAIAVPVVGGVVFELLEKIISYLANPNRSSVVLPPTEGDSQPNEIMQTGALEIKEPKKKEFEPATFVLRKDLEIEQRDIMDQSTPNILKNRTKRANEPDPNAPVLPPKKRGRPRKPAFIAKEAQENLTDENANKP